MNTLRISYRNPIECRFPMMDRHSKRLSLKLSMPVYHQVPDPKVIFSYERQIRSGE